MKNLLFLLFSLFLVSNIQAQTALNSIETAELDKADFTYSKYKKNVYLCASYNSSTGEPTSKLFQSWDIKQGGGSVYMVYNNGGSAIKTDKTLSLFIDKLKNDGTKNYKIYDTEHFDVKSGSSFATYNYIFKEAGFYKIAVYQDGKYLATTYTIITVEGKREDAASNNYSSNNNYTSNSDAANDLLKADLKYSKYKKNVYLCNDYNQSTGEIDNNDISNNWNSLGFVYIVYNNGSAAIDTKNNLSLFIDKAKEDGSGEYKIYDTESFDVKSGKSWAMYDYEFKEAGIYKIMVYQDGKYLATTYAQINDLNKTSSNNNSNNETKYTYNNNGKESIKLVATYNNNTGDYTDEASAWNITDDASYIYVYYDNAGSKMTGTTWLYIDKKNEKGDYVPYGTEEFENGNTWSVYDFNFKDAGDYKISAVKELKYLATTYATVSKKGSNNNYSSNNSDKTISLCEDYNKTTGKPSGIYTTWNIKEDGGYVYVVYENGGKKINDKLWLYVDKENTSGNYIAYDTKTFDNTDGKSWAMYDYNFKEPGNYKISAVNSFGEQASVEATIKFTDGVKVEEKKTIALCESYDDYGNAVGINNTWLIPNDGGWVYILFDNGSGKVGNEDYALYIDKKNTSTGKYDIFDTKYFNGKGNNWSVYDYNFKDAGDYKISAAKDGKIIATTEATIKYKTTSTKTENKYADKVDTWYYDGSDILVGTSKYSSGSLGGIATDFTIPSSGKTLYFQYKDDKACKAIKATIKIFNGDNYSNLVDTKTMLLNPDQKNFNFEYNFKDAGKYKVSVYNEDETFMNLAIFTVSKEQSSYTNNSNNNVNYNNSNSYKQEQSYKTSDKGKRFALVVGNGNYAYAGQLPNPVHDAEEMAKSLKACGFEVILLINTSKKQLNEAINQFGQSIISNKDAIGMIFYAGHGIQAKGENYLIPIDAQLMVEGDLEYECVNVGKILSKMDAAKNQMNIIVLDACRNNPFERSWSRNANGNGLASMNAPEGTIIAYSTNPGNVASDGSGYNSPYTTAFLGNLQKSGLTIEKVLKNIALELKTTMPGQMPWYSSSITGDFYFRP
ncbi:MAG: caspase family protein [Chitinophagales bacterium]